jgi:hypothetical protein
MSRVSQNHVTVTVAFTLLSSNQMKDTKSILTLLISSRTFDLEFDIRMGHSNRVVVVCDSKAKTDIIMILVRSEFSHRSSNAPSGISF